MPDGYELYRLISETGEVNFNNLYLWRGGYLTVRVFADNVNISGLMMVCMEHGIKEILRQLLTLIMHMISILLRDLKLSQKPYRFI